MQAPNWAAAAPNWAAAAPAAEGVALQEQVHGMTAVYNKILGWHKVEEAAAGMAVGCTGHLMVEVLRRGGWCMAEKEEQSCTGKVLHGGAAAVVVVAAAADGCSDSSLHYGHCL